MKHLHYVYDFHPVDRFFLEFSSPQFCRKTGKPLLRCNSTFIPPPDNWSAEKIPIFNGNRWEIVDNAFWQPTIYEVSYNSGRLLKTWRHLEISLSDFPAYPSLDLLSNSELGKIRILEQLVYIEYKFIHCLNLYKSVKAGNDSFMQVARKRNIPSPPSAHSMIKFELEALVFQVRQLLDSFCRLTELLVYPKKVNKRKSFLYDSVGDLFRKGSDSYVYKIMIGHDDYRSDDTEFLKISNNLFNAIKHTHMNSENFSLIGADTLTITAFHAPRGRHDKVIDYHNHNAFQFMMGFQDTIMRILQNQKKFVQTRA